MLRAIYELADLEPGQVIDLREKRGAIVVRIDRNARLEDVIATMNAVCEEFFAGGQWFQLWKGEIVTIDSPEDPRDGGTIARLHRGPLVQEGTVRSGHTQAHAG
ncbi:hypothetical protein ACIQU4_15285 [Streptomyces sp. NPDC090741]|uniref:hypothetical protein n=1 Tax=Streptomyces sp. NPDC090741 TaxID=3365967 RepID=UPI0037FD02EB